LLKDRDDYKRKFRERSVVNSSRFRNCLDRTSEDALDDQFWSLSIKTTPLLVSYLLGFKDFEVDEFLFVFVLEISSVVVATLLIL